MGKHILFTLMAAICLLEAAMAAVPSSCFEKQIVLGKSSSGTFKDDMVLLQGNDFHESARIKKIKTCVVQGQLRGIQLLLKDVNGKSTVMNYFGTISKGCETLTLENGEYISLFGLHYNNNQGVTEVEFTTNEGNFRTRGGKNSNDYYRKFRFSSFKPMIGFVGTSAVVPSSLGMISFDSQCDQSNEEQDDGKSSTGQSFNEQVTEAPEDERAAEAGPNFSLIVLIVLILAVCCVTALGIFCCFKIRRNRKLALIAALEDPKTEEDKHDTVKNSGRGTGRVAPAPHSFHQNPHLKHLDLMSNDGDAKNNYTSGRGLLGFQDESDMAGMSDTETNKSLGGGVNFQNKLGSGRPDSALDTSSVSNQLPKLGEKRFAQNNGLRMGLALDHAPVSKDGGWETDKYRTMSPPSQPMKVSKDIAQQLEEALESQGSANVKAIDIQDQWNN